MTDRMLIDASHPEETRVVVQRNNRIEEFDFESASRKQLRGNIYLAKVIRVEPSLQAAFVEYGGNRHGFLAFSEIHPDYYQIPVADRLALLEEEARFAAREEGDDENRRQARSRPKSAGAPKRVKAADDESVSDEASDETVDAPASRGRDPVADETDDDQGSVTEIAGDEASDDEDVVEQVGAGDALDEMSDRPARARRHHYKIQEVIKRRQVLLVQVVKEERGTKGAALTTYLSLAGRYSVLMPNTARGGGISRKITDATDRKRLKSIAQELEVPEGMGVILRTAGAARTKIEVKRDFEYLLRVWETVRELTLKSSAPTLTYEEGSLIKRAIRDLYSKDIEDFHVAGDEGFREAREFMKMLMPSQAKVVKLYKEPQPIFARFGVEAQLDAMFSNTVTLRSGGYIVINPTEALVSIDVNSGRSTREHNIEDTALKTNLEAAEEVARQLRLRDLAGLVVIDFIDMEEKRNNRAVERKLKECLKNDRARIQVGRISHFGLMEMSRQRIRTGVLESSTSPCPHCGGTGFIRATPSVALHIIRGIEEALLKNAAYNLTVCTRTEAALYVLNQKRLHLRELEKRFGVTITVLVDDTLTGTQYFTLERGDAALGPRYQAEEVAAPISDIAIVEDDVVEEEEVEEELDEAAEAESDIEAKDGENGREASDENGDRLRKRRRRRRRRGRGGEREFEGRAPGTSADGTAEADGGEGEDDTDEDAEEGTTPAEIVAGDETVPAEIAAESDDDGTDRPRRRRGRRGGRRLRREDGSEITAENDDQIEHPIRAEGLDDEALPPEATAAAPNRAPKPDAVVVAPDQPGPELVAEPAPKKRRRTRKTVEAVETADVAEAPAEKEAPGPLLPVAKETAAENVKDAVAPQPVAAAPVMAVPIVDAPETSSLRAEQVAPPAPVIELEGSANDAGPKKSGWWGRAKKVLGA